MPKLRSIRPIKKGVLARLAFGILLPMSLLMAAIALAGCVGTTSPAPAKINPAPNPAALQIMTTSFASGSVGANYSGR